MMSVKKLGIFLVGALLCACAGPQSRLRVGRTAQGEVIEAVGETNTDRSSLAETRKKSMADAQRRAVEMVVGVQLSAKTRVDKAMLVESNILSRAEGYIRQYDVLQQWEEGPLYRTRIRALVANKDLDADLRSAGIIAPGAPSPRFEDDKTRLSVFGGASMMHKTGWNAGLDIRPAFCHEKCAVVADFGEIDDGEKVIGPSNGTYHNWATWDSQVTYTYTTRHSYQKLKAFYHRKLDALKNPGGWSRFLPDALWAGAGAGHYRISQGTKRTDVLIPGTDVFNYLYSDAYTRFAGLLELGLSRTWWEDFELHAGAELALGDLKVNGVNCGGLSGILRLKYRLR